MTKEREILESRHLGGSRLWEKGRWLVCFDRRGVALTFDVVLDGRACHCKLKPGMMRMSLLIWIVEVDVL